MPRPSKEAMVRERRRRAYQQRERARKRAARERKLAAARAYLGDRCNDCGDPYGALEFHHAALDVKRAEVTRLWSYGQVFWDEVEKCLLLCRACHRLRHYAEADVPKVRREEPPF